MKYTWEARLAELTLRNPVKVYCRKWEFSYAFFTV